MKKLGLLVLAIIMILGAFIVASSAQGRYYRRPVIIRHYDPFWRGTLWDPYWGMRDPFYWQMREEYYDKKAVSDSSKKLAKDREKFYADGYLDPKEAEKLAKDQQKQAKAVEKLNKY